MVTFVKNKEGAEEELAIIQLFKLPIQHSSSIVCSMDIIHNKIFEPNDNCL